MSQIRRRAEGNQQDSDDEHDRHERQVEDPCWMAILMFWISFMEPDEEVA